MAALQTLHIVPLDSDAEPVSALVSDAVLDDAELRGGGRGSSTRLVRALCLRSGGSAMLANGAVVTTY